MQWVGIVSKGLPALKVSGIGSDHIFLCIKVFSCAVFALGRCISVYQQLVICLPIGVNLI